MQDAFRCLLSVKLSVDTSSGEVLDIVLWCCDIQALGKSYFVYVDFVEVAV